MRNTSLKNRSIYRINDLENEFELEDFTPTFEDIAEAYFKSEERLNREEAELEQKAA